MVDEYVGSPMTRRTSGLASPSGYRPTSTDSDGENQPDSGTTVTPARSPVEIAFEPTPAWARIARIGRTTSDAVAPSGTPASAITPKRRCPSPDTADTPSTSAAASPP